MKRFRKNVALKTKAAEPHNREALPPCVRCAMAEHVCLLGSIAVTFGTLGKPFERRGLWKNKIRSLSLQSSPISIYEDRAE